MADPAHNRFKAPFYALLALIFVVLAVRWAVRGLWLPVVICVPFVIFNAMAWRLARSPRNPWWFRSFLDGR
jgi:hypothetical protein